MKPWQEGKGGRDRGMGKQGEGGRGFLPGLQERSRCQRIREEGVPCSRLASLNPGDAPARRSWISHRPLCALGLGKGG